MLKGFILLFISVYSAFCFAKEPINLASYKDELIRYHDSGQYDKDINAVIIQAMDYLKHRLAQADFQGKPAIVLDIDETSISNYPNMVKLNFGGTLDEIRQNEVKGIDPVISPTLKLFRFAKENNVAVFFITGRHEFEREATIKNLQQVGYANWDGLILRPHDYEHKPATSFKTARRKQIEAQGYDIILNIGDQPSDLRGGYADKSFKLPDPYYLIP